MLSEPLGSLGRGGPPGRRKGRAGDRDLPGSLPGPRGSRLSDRPAMPVPGTTTHENGCVQVRTGEDGPLQSYVNAGVLFSEEDLRAWRAIVPSPVSPWVP